MAMTEIFPNREQFFLKNSMVKLANQIDLGVIKALIGVNETKLQYVS